MISYISEQLYPDAAVGKLINFDWNRAGLIILINRLQVSLGMKVKRLEREQLGSYLNIRFYKNANNRYLWLFANFSMDSADSKINSRLLLQVEMQLNAWTGEKGLDFIEHYYSSGYRKWRSRWDCLQRWVNLKQIKNSTLHPFLLTFINRIWEQLGATFFTNWNSYRVLKFYNLQFVLVQKTSSNINQAAHWLPCTKVPVQMKPNKAN